MSDDPDPGTASGFGGPELRALSAFVDDELTAAEHQALGARLAANRRAASLVASYRAQRGALRVLCADPDAQTTKSYVVLRRRTPWWRRTALAVSSLAAGAALVGLTVVIATPVAPQSAQMTFAEQADLAYVVYAPARRHPVEVTAAREGALIAWLSKRLARPLSPPALREYGYTLLGGRLLPGIAGPARTIHVRERGQRAACASFACAGCAAIGVSADAVDTSSPVAQYRHDPDRLGVTFDVTNAWH